MPSAPAPTSLSRRIVLVMAVGCGAAVANNYYGQPLLDVIAASFGVSPSTAGLIVTASQLGYALGLVFIVPLGDLLERRSLIVRLLLATAAALAVTAAAPALGVLAAALAVVGVTTVVAQVLIPLSAALAPEHERGKVVGIVMSGLLIGILVARTVSGLIAALGGWRLVYALAAAVMLTLAVVLRRTLPESLPDRGGLTYRSLLRSVAGLVRTSPVLRRRMVYGATGMAGFSLVWTALTLLLSDAPYGYGEATIGLFGLFGLAGALSAQAAGRLGDRGWTQPATGAFLAAVLGGWGAARAGGPVAGRADRRPRPVRPRRPGAAHPQSEPSLHRAPRGPRARHHRVHGGQLPRRRAGLGERRAGVRSRRLGGRHRGGRRDRADRPGRVGAGAGRPPRAGLAALDHLVEADTDEVRDRRRRAADEQRLQP
ncbi:MFS transporter [Svornostia abyssi]|uniref:MFS transporter n=1 Tax=Svornostia abyssi TaxID=2898438 RepID=A0ABY5PEC2_9ACTN|nr:MFS transporter [Parviterribacteraceae bacterium J379]